jgi:hypothetical protein
VSGTRAQVERRDVNRVAGTLVNVLWWAGALFGLVGGAFIVGLRVTGLVT